MASDARVRYTKMVIIQSFIQLLSEKAINKITVKEICDLAELNRATFYKHYLDVYDLLDKIEKQFLEELQKVLDSKENSSAEEMIQFILVHLKTEEKSYKAICSPNGDPTFPTKIFEACRTFSFSSKTLENKGLSEQQKDYTYRFIAYGCNGILNQWISDGMPEPIEEISNFSEKLINNILAHL